MSVRILRELLEFFLQAFIQISIIFILWGCLSTFSTLVIQSFIDIQKTIHGISLVSIFAMFFSGYVCFLLFPIIPDYDEILILLRNPNTLFENFQKPPLQEKIDSDVPEIQKIGEVEKFVYEKLLQLRDLDNHLLWTRVNMLIVFQGVILAALIAGFKEIFTLQPNLLFFIISLGFCSSVVLYAIAKGGSYWVTHWQVLLVAIEPLVIGKYHIFSNLHHVSDPNFKSYQKKKGYASTRDWIIVFTMLLPLVWIIIFIVFLSIYS